MFFINLSFLVFTRWAKTDIFVRNKLEHYLAEQLKAEVSIGNFTFNDKQLNVSDFSIKKQNGQYKIYIKQIYVEYHLLKLLFSRFKNLSEIRHIRLYEPEIEFTVLPSGNEVKKGFEFPDFEHLFRDLTIYNGKFYIHFESKHVKYEEYFENISVTMQNKKKTSLKLSAKNIHSGVITFEADIQNKTIEKAYLEWFDYQPAEMYFSFFNSFRTTLNLRAFINQNQLSYQGNIIHTKIDVMDNPVVSPLIRFEGDEKKLFVSSEEIYFNQNLLFGSVSLTNFLTEKGTISGDLYSKHVNLNKFYDKIEGIGSADVKIRGNLKNPEISGQVHCSELNVENQKIRSIDASVKLKPNSIQIKMLTAYWHDHKFYGSGAYHFNKTLDFNLRTDNFQWYLNDFIANGSAQAKISYKNGFTIKLHADDVHFEHPKFSLQNLQLTADLEKKNYQVEVFHPAKQIHFLGKGNLDDASYQAKLELKKFNLDSFLSTYSFPSISGFIECESDKNVFEASSSLRLYDKAFGKLDGRISLDLKRDFINDTSQLEIETHNMKFNYEDFHFMLSARGSADSLHTTDCRINKEIDVSGWLRIKPDFDYGVKLSGQKIQVTDCLKYVVNDSRKFSGRTTFIIEYDSHKDKNLVGVVQIDKFRHGEMNELQANLQFYGTRSFIAIPQFSIFSKDLQLIGLQGDVILEPDLSIKAVGKINEVELNSVFPAGNVKGLINGDFLYVHHNHDFVADLDIQAKNLNIFGIQADSLELICSQKKNRLEIVNFLAERKKQYKLQAFGALGYTFWNSKTYLDTNLVNLQFEGDLLHILANYFNGIQYAKSKSSIALEIGIVENGLSIREGTFLLSNAELKVKNQMELVDRIQIDWEIKNNFLQIKESRFRMGEGFFYITNKIDNDEEDFVLGMLNLGKFYARTDERGILLHIPGYMPFNSVVKAEISGRYGNHFKIIGPFDNLKLVGDVHVSHGGIMYPPDLDNILKLFGKITEERKKNETITTYPFTLDIMFHVKDNIRYVTYPANIMVAPGNYLHLQYYDDSFHVENATFTSKEGLVNMFGTNLNVEQIDVQINPYFKGVHINGLLYKRALDGTIITMEVFHNPMEKQSSFLQFRLYSDNPNDGTLDVLAKLRYNRSLDEISDAEKKTLIQDEVVQLAGLGLESAILDPLIYPLENQIRRLFRLDMFHVQTGIIKNFFNRYYFEREEEKNFLLKEELDNITEFGSEMFLNNLTITIGKYLSQKLFLMYETKFEKPTDVAITSKLGINHSFTLRYDLPKRYKVAYRYKIFPFDERDSHEIALERAFRFW